MMPGCIQRHVREGFDAPNKLGLRGRHGTGRMLLVVPLIALLTGCAHYYTKPGMTSGGFSRDKQDCERVAKQAAERNGTRVCDEVERCLMAKGWKKD